MPNPSSCRPVYTLHLRLRTALGPPTVPWIEPPLGLRRANGSLDLIGQSAALHPAVCLVLSYGRYATVLGSPVLQRAVVEEARRIIACYEDA